MPAREGFMSRTNVRFALCLLVTCWAAAVPPASAQRFQQMEGTLTQVAVGRNEVWGLNGSEVYRFNGKKFAKIKGSLTQISVGGGTLLQLDEVWGINSDGYAYRYDFSTKALDFVAGGKGCPTCAVVAYSQIAVGPGYEDSCHPYEIWGITNFGTVRYNYCTSQFESITSPSGVSLVQIATGGGDIWATDSQENFWEYLGAAGWGNGGGLHIPIPQIAVGVNDVWVIFANGWIWNFAVDDFGSSVVLFQPTWSPTQIATGGDGVWVLYNTSDASGLIARYDFQQAGFSSPFSLTSPAVQIAVGSGAGVWVVDSSGQVYAFVRP